MTELVLVLTFTAAGIGAALLALRLAGGSPLIRGLALGFCALALANLALHLWRVLAADAEGAARAGGLAALVFLLVWGYRRILRRVRRAADRRGQTGGP